MPCLPCSKQTTGRGPVDWPALYRAVEKESLLGALRFRAAFTDGGTVRNFGVLSMQQCF